VKAFIDVSQMTVSQMSVTETTASPQHKLQWLSEQPLNWSGLPVVHVRPTVFLEGFFLTLIQGIKSDQTARPTDRQLMAASQQDHRPIDLTLDMSCNCGVHEPPRSKGVDTMTKRVLTDALAAGDLPAAVAALDQNVVFHSPILATTGNEVRGHTVVVKILQTAFACFGMPRNVDEFQNYNGRYIVTFDGSIGGNLIQVAILVTENAAGKVESLRVFARPWPIVKLFREFMERNLRPDPVPDAIWNLPAT
jgi:hypothetical protein